MVGAISLSSNRNQWQRRRASELRGDKADLPSPGHLQMRNQEQVGKGWTQRPQSSGCREAGSGEPLCTPETTGDLGQGYQVKIQEGFETLGGEPASLLPLGLAVSEHDHKVATSVKFINQPLNC
jgi:hypothetical protein